MYFYLVRLSRKDTHHEKNESKLSQDKGNKSRKKQEAEKAVSKNKSLNKKSKTNL